MNATEQFNGLNGNIVSREHLQGIVDLAKTENDVNIIYRLSKVLNDNPDTTSFEIENIEVFETENTGLNAPRHTGTYKQALDDCGRLKKGWKFENGSVVRVENPKSLKKQNNPKKESKPKVAVSQSNKKTKPVKENPKKEVVQSNKKTAEKTSIPQIKVPALRKTGIESLSVIVGNDELRPQLKGVYADKNGYVAMDAHKLVILNAVTKKSEIGKIINIRKGSKRDLYAGLDFIEATYPNYKTIIPEYKQKTKPQDINEVLQVVYSAHKSFKGTPTEAKLKNYIESNGLYYSVGLLYDVLRVLKANGTKTVVFSAHEKRALLINTDNKHIALLMPVYIADEKNFTITEYPELLDGGINSTGLNAPNVESDLFGGLSVSETSNGLGLPFLYGMENIEETHDEDVLGLGKPISQEEIYNYVTDLIINTIKEVGHLPWQKNWVGSGSDGEAKNYVTKKPYSGVNWFLLNFEVKFDKEGNGYLVPIKFKQPYYLTFNQIKETGATLKKGSSARRVLYYTMIFSYDNGKLKFRSSDTKKINEFIKENGISKDDLLKFSKTVGVVKYYNVFRADDCTGLKFPKSKPTKNINPIEQAQSIIDNYPKHPKYTFVGSSAHYTPSKDVVNMPKISAFNKEEEYYCTYFHEITHSTGHEKRLNRDLTGKFGSTNYAFEELIAELGAVFLCAESGILFTTVENSAKYLAGWNKRLINELENDNRFFLKASAQAQKAVNHILNRDDKGLNAPNIESDLFRGLKVSVTDDDTGLAKPKNSLIIPMSSEPPKDVEFFDIPNEFGKFLGQVEKKPVGSVAVTLDAPQGGGKTRLFYYIMDLLAEQGYKCLFVSLEEHPLSELAQAKKRQYIKPENQKLIDMIGEIPRGMKDLEQLIPDYDIILIDSWGKVTEKEKIDFDNALRKKFNGKLFFVIFQRTVTGTMRGGSASQFDGDIIMKIAKSNTGDFKENYAFHDKNRYQSIELDKLKFNLYTKKLIKEKPTKTKKDE